MALSLAKKRVGQKLHSTGSIKSGGMSVIILASLIT